MLAVLIFLLQLFPYTGIFLMMLAAPFWSVILINLGFILMAWDAWRGPARRWLMIFPIFWFGGYLAATSISHWQVSRYATSIEAGNAGQRIAFDPARQDVVIVPDSHDSSNGSKLRIETLVDDFGLDRAYQQISYSPDGYRSYSLFKMVCPTSIVKNNDDGTTTTYLHPTDRQGYRIRGARDLCIVQGSQAPQRPVVRVWPQPQVGGYGDGLISQDITIEPTDGPRVRLRSGWALPLTWLPQPVIGCGLDSGTPAWRCIASMAQQSARRGRKNQA